MFKKSIQLLSLATALVFTNFTFSQEGENKVSDKDLETFVEIYQEVENQNQQLQKSLVGIIEEEGMEINRFNEIYEASQNPQAEVEISKEEEVQHQSIMQKIESKQSKFQEEVAKLIVQKGMTVEKYQMVFMQIQQDPVLQEKFTALVQG